MADPRVPLISATGSVAMGRKIGEVVARRLGRSLLELGGNNGLVVTDDADIDLALRAVLFAAVGTAGQRCTTTRRLFLQRRIADQMKSWDMEQLISLIEVNVGKDLQYIRFNGSLIGGLAGLALYSLEYVLRLL